VDCASVAESVVESELFGHAKGAFTGASEATAGLFRTAAGGTLFLDEVGELNLATQSRLLRVLQEREVRPVGSPRAYPVDVRVLAATNRDLPAEVARGRFREDLFYRLNVVVVPVPPLRLRKGDIPMIAGHFLRRIRGESQAAGGLSADALEALTRHDWPGNVRELQNAVTRAATLARSEVIALADLPESLRGASGRPTPRSEGTISSYERMAIIDALEKAGGNRRRAARILGIGEATLYRKIRQMGISR
jgi:DNA-binding NtrC family response regulator